MNVKLKQTPGVYLVGFMGCGKTTVGRALAERLGWEFADADDDIEAKAAKPIAEIFDTEGEEAFRRLETDAIHARVSSVRRGKPLVLALGGGAFTREENVTLLTENGITVWLDCGFDLVRRRVAGMTHRPLARDPEKFAALYETRREAYAKAEYRVAEDGDDPQAAVEKILTLTCFK